MIVDLRDGGAKQFFRTFWSGFEGTQHVAFAVSLDLEC